MNHWAVYLELTRYCKSTICVCVYVFSVLVQLFAIL